MIDAVAITVNGSAYNGVESNSNSLDRSVCSSLGGDEVASCSANEDFSTSVADPDEQVLLEKLQHANRFVPYQLILSICQSCSLKKIATSGTEL